MQRGDATIHSIILAGAHAWGESVLERVCPRPLLPVAGRPLIWFALDWVRQSGISAVTVCANSDTQALRSCLAGGECLGLSLEYYEDVMPRGPAGCTLDAALRRPADHFVVVEGTILPQMDLPALLEAHRQSGAALTVVAAEQGSGSAGRRTLEPIGVYVVSRAALELIPPKGYQDIKEMWLPRLYQHGYAAVPYLVRDDVTLRVNGVGSYLTACARATEGLARQERLGEEYERLGTAWVHRSAEVSPAARINGNVLIGPNVTVEAGAAVMGPTVIGPGSRIRASAIASQVIAWAHCDIGTGAILNRCILLNGSKVEAGLVVRDTVWCAEQLQSPLSGERASYWALRGASGDRPGLDAGASGGGGAGSAAAAVLPVATDLQRPLSAGLTRTAG